MSDKKGFSIGALCVTIGTFILVFAVGVLLHLQFL